MTYSNKIKNNITGRNKIIAFIINFDSAMGHTTVLLILMVDMFLTYTFWKQMQN